MRISIYLFLLLIIASTSACNLINPAEGIPAYIHIKEYQFETNIGTEGSNSQRIEDVWVYVDNNLLGAYDLPATIPILSTGEQEVVLDPGIRENGISALPTVYPYISRVTLTANLEAGVVDTLSPVGRYSDDVEFLFVEGFDENHIFDVDRDDDDGTFIEASTDNALDGKSGRIHLTTDHSEIQVATRLEFFDLPETGFIPVYLELDYKTDVEVLFGLIGLNDSGTEEFYYSHALNPKSDWNKVYLNLTEVIVNSRLNVYQVGIAARLPIDMSLDEANIYLDNIKLLHRKE